MSLKEITQRIFAEQFGHAPEYCFQAPGRVNLIGEHTDYNDGFVLPCAINYQTVISCAPRDDQQVRVIAVDYANQQDHFRLDLPITRVEAPLWANYIRGVVRQLQQAGHRLPGVDMVISGNVPQGAGLSSSASLEVAVGTMFTQLAALPVTPGEVARIGQQAENLFVGCNCGIMDQMISALGQPDHALLLDCRSLETRFVPIPAGISIMIINSNVQRNLVGSEYNDRRAQCERGAHFFKQPALRDVTLEEFEQQETTMDPLVARRVRHIVTENIRTLAAAEALQQGEMAKMSVLMAASHASMRDDFEITVPAIDTLVEIVQAELGDQGGVRMTGGGFGGCVVALVPDPLVEVVRQAVVQHYEPATGLVASVYVCQTAAGASLC